MSGNLLVLVFVAMMCFVSSAAMAAESGPYIGVRSGIALLQDSDLGFTGDPESDVPAAQFFIHLR